MAKKKNRKEQKISTVDLQVSEKLATYRSSVGIRTRNHKELIRTIKNGLPISSFEKLKNQMEITEKTLAGIVNITLRTLARRKKEGRFQSDESERILRLGLLFDKSLMVFGDKESAKRWFKSSKRALDGKPPLEYADSEIGAREVEDILGRIEHGIFS